jgi:hypothetical protein
MWRHLVMMRIVARLFYDALESAHLYWGVPAPIVLH